MPASRRLPTLRRVRVGATAPRRFDSAAVLRQVRAENRRVLQRPAISRSPNNETPY